VADVTRIFRCDNCGETFRSGWSDEEAEAEMRSDWGDLPEQERAVICSGCHAEFVWWARLQGLLPR